MPNPEINQLSQEDINLMFEQEAESLGQNNEPNQEIIENITPEKIAQEFELLSDIDKKFITSDAVDDQKFEEIVGKHRGESRKADVMILMRRLIKKNHPLASKINYSNAA